MQSLNSAYGTSQKIIPNRNMERFGAFLLVLVLLQYFTGFSAFPKHIGLSYLEDLGGELPFGAPSEGNISVQIIWALFSLSALGAIYFRFSQTKKIVVLSFPLLLLLAWCVLSLFWAPDLAIAFRRYVRFLLVIITALGIAVSISSYRTLISALLIVTGFVMVTDFFSAYLLPGMAQDPEGNFLGAWHSQKNESGAIASYSFIIWLSCARHASRTRSRWMYIIGAGLWLSFLYNTGSKTGLFVGITAPVIAIIILGILKNYSTKSLILIFSIFTSAVIFYVLSLYIFNTTFSKSIELLVPNQDLTFTGRVDIWNFVLREISNHPLVGQGFASFWGIGDQSPALVRGAGTVTMIGQAHNGYLDMLATIGVIGMVLFSYYYFAMVRNVIEVACHRIQDRAYFSVLEIIIGLLVATTIYDITESSFLQAGSFRWFLFVLFGFVLCRMRLLARSVPQGQPEYC